MRSRQFLNALLLIMTVVLIWATTQVPHQKSPPGETRVMPLDRLDPDAITEIRLHYPNRPDITLRYSNRHWRMLTPRLARADETRIRSLLNITAEKSETGFRAAGNDLSQYGLEPAKARLWFNDLHLDIGNREPLSGQRYVRLDDQVYLIDDAWSGYLFSTTLEFVSPRLLPAGAHPVRIQLLHERWEFRQNHWQRYPAAATASDDSDGAALANAWSRARARAVQTFNPKLPWQGPLRVDTQANAGPFKFEYADTTAGLILGRRDAGLQYLLKAASAAALLGTADRP